MKKYKIGGQFSGVGAFDQALIRLGIDYENVYQAEWDKFARQTYLHNYEEPLYYVEDVYNTDVDDITNKHGSLDIMMFSPPCQSFSLAGKRKGEDDERGILFYNSHEFIQKNKPRFFIFENVKGLLSDSDGKTFRAWVEFLGGKSINGNPVIFPHEKSVPYHIYYKVLNAKDFNIPQNRERVFIVGIRDDEDNTFTWPKEMFLEKRLKDVLESEVDEKYYLSENQINSLLVSKFEHSSRLHDINKVSPTLTTMQGGGQEPKIKIKSSTSKGFEIAEIEEDSINFEHPNSETRRGRVGKKIAQTLTTSCNQGVLVVGFERTQEAKEKRSKSIKEKGIDTGNFSDRQLKLKAQDYSDTVLANPNHQKEGLIAEFKIGAIRGRNPDNPTSRKSGEPTQQMLEINENGTSNALTTVQKDNVVIQINPSKESGGKQPYQSNRVYDSNGIMTTLNTECGRPQVTTKDYRIRKLTPRECFRLMDFPESFSWPVSDSQAYKQAGNSICVGVLSGIISKLNIKK